MPYIDVFQTIVYVVISDLIMYLVLFRGILLFSWTFIIFFYFICNHPSFPPNTEFYWLFRNVSLCTLITTISQSSQIHPHSCGLLTKRRNEEEKKKEGTHTSPICVAYICNGAWSNSQEPAPLRKPNPLIHSPARRAQFWSAILPCPYHNF